MPSPQDRDANDGNAGMDENKRQRLRKQRGDVGPLSSCFLLLWGNQRSVRHRVGRGTRQASRGRGQDDPDPVSKQESSAVGCGGGGCFFRCRVSWRVRAWNCKALLLSNLY
jgi:hypothetical protein